jgi:hypothetical protein
MAYAFKAKPAFGTLIKSQYQSDYILNKKNKNVNVNVNNYERYLFLKKKCYVNSCFISVKKSNIIAGLYYKMNLNNVCVVNDGPPCSNVDTCDICLTPAKIDINSVEPFFQTNTIDPLGALFGNSECGVNNFTHYMELSKL